MCVRDGDRDGVLVEEPNKYLFFRTVLFVKLIVFNHLRNKITGGCIFVFVCFLKKNIRNSI